MPNHPTHGHLASPWFPAMLDALAKEPTLPRAAKLTYFQGWCDVATASFHVPPGDPRRLDADNRYREALRLDERHVVHRAVVFPQAWRAGQVLTVAAETRTGWQPGDWVAWEEGEVWARNDGDAPWPLLLVTGWRAGPPGS